MKGVIEEGYKDTNEAIIDGFKKYLDVKVFGELIFMKTKT